MTRLLIYLWLLMPALVFGYSKEIPFAYVSISISKNIPPEIVYSVALAESGYSWESVYNPWPWTLNIDGKGYRFKNRIEAFNALKSAVGEGRSVDIGIMQVNWYWHKSRFKNLWSALDPYINLSVGIDILMERYQKTNKWWVAVGQYHAPGRSKKSKFRADAYRKRVRKQWEKIERSNQNIN